MIAVPDASVLLKWILPGDDERDTAAALALRDEAANGAVDLVVPQLWVYEVGNTLARRFPDEADELLAALVDFGLTEARLDPKWRTQAVSLAVTYEVAFYDAAYHAVALALGGVFVTADQRYVRRTSRVGGVSSLRTWRGAGNGAGRRRHRRTPVSGARGPSPNALVLRTMPDTRLIERWLPISALGEESVRERRSMTALPPIYYLHVWWARRPLVASRAAVLASLLPADADREKFLHVIGIHGDPVATRRRIDAARRKGERFEGQAYTYARAFSHSPDRDDRQWLTATLDVPLEDVTILDPTAGGGSIPIEAMVLGTTSFANDLNPVSALIIRGTVEWPASHGSDLKKEFEALAERFIESREEKLKPYFPPEPIDSAISTNFLWARTVTCPYCDGLVPLSPNWWKWQVQKGPLWPREKGPPETGAVAGIEAVCVP